jgi:hypothetical protein
MSAGQVFGVHDVHLVDSKSPSLDFSDCEGQAETAIVIKNPQVETSSSMYPLLRVRVHHYPGFRGINNDQTLGVMMSS